MAENKIGSIPEFSTDGSVGEAGEEEVKETSVDEILEEGKETPSEPPADETPGEEETEEETTPAADAGSSNPELERQVKGLQEERTKLLKEIQDLRGTRREIKQQELITVNKQIDELKDLNQQDIAVVERIMKAKGYLTKEESERMYYDAVKQEELNKFLTDYPEYKPENDPNDLNWSRLSRELGYYKLPKDPHGIREILLRAHQTLNPETSGRSSAAKQRQIQVASAGSGGAQRSSSRGTPQSKRLAQLAREHTDLSEEDISDIEQSE